MMQLSAHAHGNGAGNGASDDEARDNWSCPLASALSGAIAFFDEAKWQSQISQLYVPRPAPPPQRAVSLAGGREASRVIAVSATAVAAVGAAVWWQAGRSARLSDELLASAARVQAKVNWQQVHEPLVLSPEEMCLEACVKGQAELQQVQLFGEDPAVIFRLEDEVIRALRAPGLLGLQDVLGDVARLEPPCLVLLKGPAGTGKKSIVMELARVNGMTVLQLDKAALEAAQQAAWRAGAIRWPGCVVQAAFSLAKKLQPCIVLLDKPHTLPKRMQAAVRAELQRLHGAPHLWPLQRVSVVATINHVHDWHPPFHVPARHRGETALPNIQQRRAIMLGYLQRLQQPGRPPAVQPLLMSLLTGRITGGLLGEQVEEFIASLQGRAGRQIVWLVLRAQQRVATAAAGAAGAALVAEPHRPLALADLRAALQDLVAEEALAAQQRACTSWWPWDWSPSMWVCAGALGLGVGATAAIVLADGGSRRGSGAPEVAVAP